MPTLQVKPGVVTTPETPILRRLLDVAQAACDQFGVSFVVTSARDAHSTGAHPAGRAIDLRTQGLPDWLVLCLYGFCAGALGPQFYLQYEVRARLPEGHPLRPIATVNPKASAPHLHLQFRKDLDPMTFTAPIPETPHA